MEHLIFFIKPNTYITRSSPATIFALNTTTTHLEVRNKKKLLFLLTNVFSFEDQQRVIKVLSKNDKTHPDIIFTLRFCGVKGAQTFNMITTLATITHKKLKPNKITYYYSCSQSTKCLIMQYLEFLVIPVYTQLKQGQKKPTIEGNNQEEKKV